MSEDKIATTHRAPKRATQGERMRAFGEAFPFVANVELSARLDSYECAVDVIQAEMKAQYASEADYTLWQSEMARRTAAERADDDDFFPG